MIAQATVGFIWGQLTLVLGGVFGGREQNRGFNLNQWGGGEEMP